MKYFKKIIGERLYLSPINSEDIEQYVKWMNDFDTAKGIDQIKRMVSLTSEKEYLEEVSHKEYNFSIINSETDRLMGSISLHKIDLIDRTAELGIFIGEESDRSKGYGSEAIKLLLDYGFNQINLNNIMLKVYSFNERAQKSYAKCGFKVFGIWKNSHYFNGSYCDEIFMNISREDFLN